MGTSLAVIDKELTARKTRTHGWSIAAKLAYHSVRADNGCLLWTGCVSGCGYPYLTIKGRSIRANRLAWEEVNGPIPQGKCVLHRCDNPICIEVECFFLGTKADNNRDRHDKGRSYIARGEGHASSKLTEFDVRSIRKSSTSQRALAKQYGVSSYCIYSIKKRLFWKHVE